MAIHVKQNENGCTERYKARLVAKGYSQKQGTYFCQIYTPVLKYTTLRLILAWMAQHRLYMLQVDIKIDLLNEDLHEKLYLTQPGGFV